ncbi:MAG: VOC family protein [Parasphingorhabdus sp.]|uniref:VOC family protein n=1 Tax=Parasphingorhabdus sp. TaxID=2709688 RepID=UPI00300201BC
MAELENLAYIVAEASDLDAWEEFAVQVCAMMVGYRDDNSLALRMDDRPWRIRLEKGDSDDILAVGWALASEEELEEYVAQLRSRDVAVTQQSDELAEQRMVQRLFVFTDPNGVDHELFSTINFPDKLEPFSSSVMRGNGFVTGELGIGHILPVARDYEESKQFYEKCMGLRFSDRIREEIAPGIFADATFYHTHTGRHHSLATGQFPSKKKLNHIMLEFRSMDDVGAAYDRAIAAGVPIILELGHHPNDQAFSFYMVAPSGFGLELGFGGRLIDENWEPQLYDVMSDWGHARNVQTISA